ncbi:hypothetical protein AMAG_12093 [Allomyces macrogynus ATCC 38327]|uniref:Uncharacterized protein n=1 Tax=Allomyces macrogynus (strain ATCC 38327) TaxID=578462 RepID=A0A0L0SZ96_ALLM3|nr:hypothetical protein AMAG_12093 [Allomyces macrogynus ATCC 38327]|eukprot:KNE67639.1 hypothetical protein AMAG_12093 [Allomyces macrogynus ATCC 38327]
MLIARAPICLVALRAAAEPASAPDDGHPDPSAADDGHELDSAHDVADCARDSSLAPAPSPFLTPSVPPSDKLDDAAFGELSDRMRCVRDATVDLIGTEDACHGPVPPLYAIAAAATTAVQPPDGVSGPDRAAPVPEDVPTVIDRTCAACLPDAPTMDPAVHVAVPLFGRDGDPIKHRIVFVTVSSAQVRSLDDVVAAISAGTRRDVRPAQEPPRHQEDPAAVSPTIPARRRGQVRRERAAWTSAPNSDIPWIVVAGFLFVITAVFLAKMGTPLAGSLRPANPVATGSSVTDAPAMGWSTTTSTEVTRTRTIWTTATATATRTRTQWKVTTSASTHTLTNTRWATATSTVTRTRKQWATTTFTTAWTRVITAAEWTAKTATPTRRSTSTARATVTATPRNAWKKNAAIEKAAAQEGNGFINTQGLHDHPAVAAPGDPLSAITASSAAHPIQLEQDPTAVYATITTDDGTWYADYHFADHSVTVHHVPADASGHAQPGAEKVFVLPPREPWDGQSVAVAGHDQVTDVLALLHSHPLDVSGVGHTDDLLAHLADLSGYHSIDLSAIQSQAHAHHIDVGALLHPTVLF